MDEKKRKKIITILIILLAICIILAIVVRNIQLKNEENMKAEDNKEENVSVEELMEDVNATADPDIYDIDTEYDGRKVLSVKTSVQFSVAFAGKINGDLQSIEEAQELTREQLPTTSGIYLGEQDNKILEYINNHTSCTYGVSDEGYLVINEQNENNDYDNRIQKIMQSDNLYIIYCDGEMRIVDSITGEIRKL